MKIIQEDTDIGYGLYNFRIENRFLNFCVGETVGGHRPATFWQNFSNSLSSSPSFGTNVFREGDRGKSYDRKTARKMNFTGVKIAWVDMKSNKNPHLYISK